MSKTTRGEAIPTTDVFDLSPAAAGEIAPAATSVEMDVDGRAMIADLTSSQLSYCSMKAEDAKSKAVLFNAMNAPQEKLSAHINETIEIAHVYVEAVRCASVQTREMVVCPRVVLIDRAGKSYQSVSVGVYGSIKKLFQVYGEPCTWESPVRVKVQQVERGDGKRLYVLTAMP